MLPQLTGRRGPAGPRGLRGPAGAAGATGPVGATGPAGASFWDSNVSGPTGISGLVDTVSAQTISGEKAFDVLHLSEGGVLQYRGEAATSSFKTQLFSFSSSSVGARNVCGITCTPDHHLAVSADVHTVNTSAAPLRTIVERWSCVVLSGAVADVQQDITFQSTLRDADFFFTVDDDTLYFRAMQNTSDTIRYAVHVVVSSV